MLKNKLEAFGSSNQHVRLMTSNELDKCLREALFVNNVGCSDSILFDISQATYHESFFDRIMKASWRCVSSRPGRVRRIQKGLNLLNYLAINGSENCISDIKKHTDILRTITKLKFSQNNRDIGQLVIHKANQLINLVMDSRTLQDKRRYATSIRDRFISVGSTNGMVETSVLHKPVFVLDKTKNNPPSKNNSFSGFGNTYNQNQQNIGPGRRFLSKLFKTNLKISNRPHNIGLYGNNLNNYNPNSNNYTTGLDVFDRVYASYTDRQESNYDENTFNAFPSLNNTNDSYYKHNFSRNENKYNNKNQNKKIQDSDSDHTFKYYPSSSSYNDDSSYTESDSGSDSSYKRRSKSRSSNNSSSSSDSDNSSIYNRGYDYRKRYENNKDKYNKNNKKELKTNKQLKIYRKYSSSTSSKSSSSSSSSSDNESRYKNRRYTQSNYKKNIRNDYSSTYTSTTSSYTSNRSNNKQYGYNVYTHRTYPNQLQYSHNRSHHGGFSTRPPTYVSSGYNNQRTPYNPFTTR